MNKTSSVVTGGVTVTAATLVPLIQWAMSGFPRPVPPDIPFLVAAGLVTGVHAVYNILAARTAAKTVAAAPVTPAASSIIQ
ncbi:hypothetical protein [Caballeronia sp. dw_19]|uniref:hypothetical protein n=1 Tax=Caballeronia sp. dw_19 TaxID=2719791 RepID=UPI001BCC877E|nr:hypothetical protein [Caballeronia sp. dw_19]